MSGEKKGEIRRNISNMEIRYIRMRMDDAHNSRGMGGGPKSLGLSMVSIIYVKTTRVTDRTSGGCPARRWRTAPITLKGRRVASSVPTGTMEM